MNLKRFPSLLLALAVLALPSAAAAAPAGSTFLVSRPDGTGPLAPLTDNSSIGPLAVSDEGRYVAFLSQADGFAPGGDPRLMNLYVRDTTTNTTTLASRSDGLNGAGVNADVEWTSRATIGITVQPATRFMDAPHDRPHVFVVFSTKATNLVDHGDQAVPPTQGQEAVWMRDVTAGTTYLISRFNTFTAPMDGRAHQPSIVAGPRGPLIAFAFRPTTNGPTIGNVYLREMAENMTRQISCSIFRCGGPSELSEEPSLRFVDNTGKGGSDFCPAEEQCAVVAFSTRDMGIIGQWNDPSISQIVVSRAIEKHDGSGVAEPDFWKNASVVWREPRTLGNASSWGPSLAPDGSAVAFLSAATNLDPLGPSLPPVSPNEGYLHSGNSTGIVSVTENAAGNPIPADSNVTQISIGGAAPAWRYGFTTGASNFGFPSDGFFMRAFQVLPVNEPASLLDRPAGASGVAGNAPSGEVALSADGTTAVFLSRSSNLNTGVGEDFTRVYRRRIDPRASGFNSLQLVSRPSGTGAFATDAKRPTIPRSAISADGRYVAFESDADDLSSADDDSLRNVFVRDTVSGTTTLVNRASGANGAVADARSELNGISENGQRVLFTTGARNFGVSQSGDHAFVRDLAAQTTTVVSRANGSTGTIARGDGMSISGDGNRVAFRSEQAVDPDGANGPHLYIRDLAAQTTTLADREDGVDGLAARDQPEDASLDRDGSRVAWSTNVSMRLPGEGNGFGLRVYVRDLATGTTILASRADGALGAPADADSGAPALNAAGDVVAFESDATNLGNVSGRSIWIRRLATGRTELVSRTNGPAGHAANQPSFNPSIDASGERVAFVTHANNFGPNPNEEGPPTPGSPTYVRDMKAKTTELVSRVSGAAGARAEPAGFGPVSISASGDCVAFVGSGLNYTDAYASADFTAVRERVLRGSCGPTSIPSAGVAEPPPEPPLLSRLQMKPTRVHVGGPDGGARISFQLSADSPVTLAFDRMARGARASGLGSRRVGHITIQGHAGANTIRFSGRLRGRPLRLGRYRWTATPLQGSATTGSFVVVRAPRR